jgi:hypothetical protein
MSGGAEGMSDRKRIQLYPGDILEITGPLNMETDSGPELLDVLKQALVAMERDWHTIYQEWGPTTQEFGDLEGAIRQKHESTDAIRSARAAIAKAEC